MPATKNAPIKATIAVKNQPPITFSTPATRYTALFAPPSSIGKGRTHCYHKGYISSRKWELKGSTNGNQTTGYHEVDSSTHEVESREVFFFYIRVAFRFSKRRSILLLSDLGIINSTALAQITVIRTKKRERKLDENFSSPPSFWRERFTPVSITLACFFGEPKGENHHKACEQQ